MANLEHNIPISPSSVFRIGSTSKQFTAAVVLLLAEEGKLSLDDDIRTLLPELPDYGTPVTIRHLLHHTSGIPDYLRLAAGAGSRSDDLHLTVDAAIAMLASQEKLDFVPGEQFGYSNSGYFLLSQIAQRASGKSLRKYAEEKIFRPLGMTNTHFHDDHKEIVPNRASGYAYREEGFQISMTTLDTVGDGGVFTTVEDLFYWDQHFYHQQIGGPQFLDQMLTRGTLNNGRSLDYASGLVHGTHRGLDTIRHGGGFVGFRAEMIRFPQRRFTVICLCNLSARDPTELAKRVADIYLFDE